MAAGDEWPKRVLISYSHEPDVWERAGKGPDFQRDRVRALCTRLRSEGLDCRIDQGVVPVQDWPRWMLDQIDEVDFVLVVATETYYRRFRGHEEPGKGLGVTWEGGIITNKLYQDGGRNTKFIPVVFETADKRYIPEPLSGTTCYWVGDRRDFDELCFRLTEQPSYVPEPIGQVHRRPSRESAPSVVPSAPPVRGNLPTRNPLFSGRGDLLAAVSQALADQRRAALVGTPGMGKTQTALEYAHRHRSAYRFALWLNAHTPDSLGAGYLALARLLHLPERDESDQAIVIEAVRRWMREEGDWLLVLDNVDEPGTVRNILPVDGGGHLILTSRDPAVAPWARLIRVTRLSPEEGARVLLRRAGRLMDDASLDLASPVDRDAALAISQAVDGLPLALDQAGAYMIEAPVDPAEYRELYESEGSELRAHRGRLSDRDSVERTFALALASVGAVNPAAGDLLRVCAFLGSEAIPEEIFLDGASELGDRLGPACLKKTSYTTLVGAAHRLSLLRRDLDARTLTVHRVVQDVVRDAMDDEAQRLWVGRAVKAVNRPFPNYNDQATRRELCDRLFPHAQVCLREAERLGVRPIEAGWLRSGAANHLEGRSRFGEAEAWLLDALAWHEAVSGAESIGVAETLHHLGKLSRIAEKDREAEDYFRRSLMIREKLVGPEHIQTAKSLNSLGVLLMGGKDSNRNAEAEGYLLRALAIRENIKGPAPLTLATVLGNVALLRSYQGRRKEAEPLLLRALALTEADEGPDSPKLLVNLVNLAGDYRDDRRFGEAESLMSRALSIAEKWFRPEDFQVGQVLGGYAKLRRAQGRFTEAESLYRRWLEIWERVFGSESPRLLEPLDGLKWVIEPLRGWYCADSEPVYRKLVAIHEASSGPNHPDTATSLSSLARCLNNLGRPAEAAPLLRRCLEIREHALGLTDALTGMAATGLADVLENLEKYDEAEALYRRHFDARRESHGLMDDETGRLLNRLFSFLHRRQRSVELLPLLRMWLLRIENGRGEEDPQMPRVLEAMANILQGVGLQQEAADASARARRIREKGSRPSPTA
jgi:tetratricopeptide (TPR) repeat protein